MANERTCAVVNCPSNGLKNRPANLKFYCFPSDPKMRSEWIRACLRPQDWTGANSTYVCSNHFDYTDFDYSDEYCDIVLKPNAIPIARVRLEINSMVVNIKDGSKRRFCVDDLINNKAESTHPTSLMELNEVKDNPHDKWQCTTCSRIFNTADRLERHQSFCPPEKKKKVRNLPPRTRPGTACFYKDCAATFYHRNKMIKHMAEVHQCFVDDAQEMTFVNMDEFWEWKEHEEERTYSYFSKRTGDHKNTSTYHCQRDGPSRSKLMSKGNEPKKRMTKGLIKENIVCLAHIKTALNPDGTVSVSYFPTHNHPLSAMDFLHHPLSRTSKQFIKEKLELGLNHKQIVDDLLASQNSSSSSNSRAMSKNQFLHMVNKLDRIRGVLEREKRKMKRENCGESSDTNQNPPKILKSEKHVENRKKQQITAPSCDEKDRDKDYNLENTVPIKAEDEVTITEEDDVHDIPIKEEVEDNVSIKEESEDNVSIKEESEDNVSIKEDVDEDDYVPIEAALEDTMQDVVEEGSASNGLTSTASKKPPVNYEYLYSELLDANSKLSKTIEEREKQLEERNRTIVALTNSLKPQVNMQLLYNEVTSSNRKLKQVIITLQKKSELQDRHINILKKSLKRYTNQ